MKKIIALAAIASVLPLADAVSAGLPDGWLPKFYNGMEAVGSVSWVSGAYKGKVGAIRMAWESGAMKFGAAKEVTTDLTGWVDWTIEAHVKSEGDYGYAGAAMEFFDERGKSLGVVSAKRPSVAKEWRKLEWTFSAPRNAKRHVAHVLSLHREPVMFAKVRVTAKPGVDKGEIPYEVAALPAEWNKDWNGGTVRMLSFSDAPLPLSFFIKGAPRGSKGLELAVDIPAELELKDAFCPHCIHYEALRPSAEPFVTNGTDYVRYVFRDPKFLKGIKPGQFMVDNGLSVTAVIGPKPGNERLEKSFRILYRLRLGGKRGQEKALDLAFRPLPVGLGRAKDFPVFSWNNTDRHFSSDAAAHAALRAYEAAGVASFRRTLSGTLVLPRQKELVALCESRPAKYIFSGRIGDVWKLGPCGLGRAKAKELGVRMAVSSDAAYADCVKDRMCPEYFTTDPRLRAHLREHVRGILSASGVKDGDWVTFDMEPWHSATWCHCEACHRAFAAFAKLDHVPTAAETQTEALRDRWALFRCSHNAKSVEMLAGIIHEYNPTLRCVDYDYVMPYGDEAGMMARRRACGKDTLVNEQWLDGHECSYYHKIGIESFRSMRNDVRHLKKFYVPVAALSGYGTYLRPGEVLNPRQIRQFALAAFVNGCRGYAFYSGVCYDGEVLVEMMKAQDEIARWEGLPWGKSDGGVVPTSASGQFAFASTVKPDGTTVLALFNYDAEEKIAVSFADRTCELDPLDVRFVEVSGPAAELAAVRSRAAARVEQIRATPDARVPDGAARRYVSAADGDDAADGLTPRTAWRTIARLNRERLSPGAFVLFARGGVYRGTVKTAPGVTYASYGEGPKPCICGSPEDGADPARWRPTDEPQVWSYDIGHQDVGTLVFDDGAAHAIKIVYRTDAKTGRRTSLYTGRPFESYRDLDGDLHFWHDYSTNGTGRIYLRSARNPGERFRSIEFNVRCCGFMVGRNAGVTIDGFTVAFAGVHGVSATTCRDLTVRNCEFRWIGGSIQAEGIFGRDHPTRFGNGVEVYGGCDGYTVSNCCFREIYDAGVTHQLNIPDEDGPKRFDQRRVRYVDNVFERCNYSVEYFLTARNGNMSRMEDVLVQGNLMLDAGCGFCEQRPDRGTAGHFRAWYRPDRNRAKDFVIRGNVLCLSKDALLTVCSGLRNADGSSSLPRFEDNVVLGYRGDDFGAVSETSGRSSAFGPASQDILNAHGAGNRCVVLPRPEISWSIMHPTAIDVAYMRRVAEKARAYGGVDSFEVCGDCHSAYGGINGLSMLEPYPHAHAQVDPKRVEKARAELNAICEIAHSAGKPLYYWHREIFIPKGLLEDLPRLLDGDGEFDLLGRTYQDYLRFKLDEAFRHVPGLDGVVLTLTEADYSVIHNSNPGRYPPQKVVEQLVRLFAEEHARRGKRFILRSFGSNTQDYVDIIGGAVAAARAYGFEVETKVTEADFVPWLSKNPFLRKNPPLALGAECDALGEFLGAGYLPAAQVARIREYVDSCRAEGVDRYTIRIDRVGNSIFDSAHEVNLYAYMRFIRDPSATADGVIGEYADRCFGKAAERMVPLVKGELEMVRNIHYIASNLTFHSFPLPPDFKTVKAGGIFSLYRENRSLESTKDIWSILSWMNTPPHAQILAEKALGRRLAAEGLATVEALKGLLPADEYARQRRAFANAEKASRALEAYTKCVVAYFEDMSARRDDPAALRAASEEAVRTIESMMADVNAVFVRKGHFTVVGEDLDLVYFAGLRFYCRELLREYRLERAQRAKLEARADVLDFVIPGGIYDDNRTIRTMHGAYSETKADRVVRYAGNPVFPNGTIAVRFDDVPGAKVEVGLDPDGAQEYALTESVADGIRTVVIGKRGARYPGVLSVALLTGRSPKGYNNKQ